MSLDARKNFALSTVATAPVTPTAGTSLVVAAGDGTARFPAAPFNAVVWPTGANPNSSNAEIVRVTAKSTDTLTITRTQEGSSVRTIVVGDQIMAGLTDKTLTDIEAYLTGVSSPTLLTPTIASHTNAQHDHTNAANGGALTTSSLPTGVVVQEVSSVSGAVATGTTLIPYDDTIPQNTEGDQYLSVTITPKSATDILVVKSTMFLSNSNGTLSLIGAIFQDSIANALAAGVGFQLTGTAQVPVETFVSMVAGTTSPITFKVRGAASAAGTTTINGQAGSRRFGGVNNSFIMVTEYKA